MSTIAPSPALTSRVTPRSTKKSWKSPKSPYLGHAKRSPKASANFHNVPSTPPLRPRKNKGNYSTTPNPKALIDRLSPSTYTGTQGATEPPLSPTKWLDTLMQSEALTAMLSSGKDVPDDASGDMNHDAVKQSSVSAGDMRTAEEILISPLSPSAAPEDQQLTSPVSSTSAADVDEILRAVPDSDQADSEMPTAVPNSPVDNPAVVAAAAPVSLYELCRRLILPLAIQNARARDTNGDGVVESEQVEQQVMSSMTNNICVDFMNTAKEVKEQMAALKKDSDGRGESIVGVKRSRDEEYSAEGSVTNRVRLNSDGAVSAMSVISPPRAPKAMIFTKQNEVLDRFMPMMIPHTDSNTPVSPTRIRRATPPPSQEPKHSGRSPTSDRRESEHDMDTDLPGCRRDHEGNIGHQRDRSHDKDKSKHHRDGRQRDKDHSRRDSQYSDRDIDGSDSGRWDFADVGTRQLNGGRKDSRYADSDLDKLGRRKHDRSDKEWDYVRNHRDSDSNSKKHSSSGSSRQHSQELVASRMSDPGVPTSTKSFAREPSSAGLSCRVPGLWFVKVGLNHMDVVNMTFEVDGEVASRCRGHNGSNIAVRLVCLPTASVEETYKQLDPTASVEVVTNAMRSVKPKWPPKGKIIVEVNPGAKVGRSWLPQELDPATSILELTAHIQPGQNNIRLIHLGDLSTHTFLLHATEAQPSSLLAGPTPKPNSSKGLLDSDWENYVARLQGIAHSDIRGGAFKFSGTIAVEAQTA